MTTVCIDLDGVIAEGADHPHYDKCEVVRGSKAALQHMWRSGCTIIIHSARHLEDYAVTERWLVENGIPFDQIVLGKPLADYYIDDRAINFCGFWDHIEEVICATRKGRDTDHKTL